LSLHSEFHAKCGSLPINLSIIFPACTLDGVERRQLHSHFQIRRDLSGYTIRKSEGSRTPDGSIGVAYQVPYKNVNEKLLHLSHLLSIGGLRDTHRQGVLQEEDLTLFNGAQSQARQDVDTLNNYDNKLDFVSCSSCGAGLACDAIAVEEESAESGGGQEAVLRVFRVCGLTSDQDRASLNRVGELSICTPEIRAGVPVALRHGHPRQASASGELRSIGSCAVRSAPPCQVAAR
jgi:hypothetical protein